MIGPARAGETGRVIAEERLSSQATVAEFEEIARFTCQVTDKVVRFEFLNGRISVKPAADGDRCEIIAWLMHWCLRSGSPLWMYGGSLGLEAGEHRRDRAKPDAVVAPEGTFAGQGPWADPEHVAMVVEVTSYDADADRRIRREKPVLYAGAGIPLCLLIDREARTLAVHSKPSPAGYRDIHTVAVGEKLSFPDPVNIGLDTGELKDYVR